MRGAGGEVRLPPELVSALRHKGVSALREALPRYSGDLFGTRGEYSSSLVFLSRRGLPSPEMQRERQTKGERVAARDRTGAMLEEFLRAEHGSDNARRRFQRKYGRRASFVLQHFYERELENAGDDDEAPEETLARQKLLERIRKPSAEQVQAQVLLGAMDSAAKQEEAVQVARRQSIVGVQPSASGSPGASQARDSGRQRSRGGDDYDEAESNHRSMEEFYTAAGRRQSVGELDSLRRDARGEALKSSQSRRGGSGRRVQGGVRHADGGSGKRSHPRSHQKRHHGRSGTGTAPAHHTGRGQLMDAPPDALAPERSIESIPDRHSSVSSIGGTDADLVDPDHQPHGVTDSQAPEKPVNYRDFLGQSSELLPGLQQGSRDGKPGQRRGSVGVDTSRLPGTRMSDFDQGMVPEYKRADWMKTHKKGQGVASQRKPPSSAPAVPRAAGIGPKVPVGIEQPSMSSMLSSDASSGHLEQQGDGMLGRLQDHLQQMGVELTDE